MYANEADWLRKPVSFHKHWNNDPVQVYEEWFRQRKFIDWKKTKHFRFRWNWGRREKVARHPSADFLLHSVGGGGDFVDTVIAF